MHYMYHYITPYDPPATILIEYITIYELNDPYDPYLVDSIGQHSFVVVAPINVAIWRVLVLTALACTRLTSVSDTYEWLAPLSKSARNFKPLIVTKTTGWTTDAFLTFAVNPGSFGDSLAVTFPFASRNDVHSEL